MKIKILIGLSIICFVLIFLSNKAINKVHVTLDLQRISNDNKAVFKLTNRGFKAVYFTGYGPNYPLALNSTESKGMWLHEKYPWCGTGQTTETLNPGQSITFEHAPIKKCKRWYINLDVYPDKNPDYNDWLEELYRLLDINRAIIPTRVKSPIITIN